MKLIFHEKLNPEQEIEVIRENIQSIETVDGVCAIYVKTEYGSCRIEVHEPATRVWAEFKGMNPEGGK